MTLNELCSGLSELLEKYHYSDESKRAYRREWDKLEDYLLSEYGSSEYTAEKGLAYLESQHGIFSAYNDGTLSRRQVWLIRVIHMLNDYKDYGVITCRTKSSKNPIKLQGGFAEIHSRYANYQKSRDLSNNTIYNYTRTAMVFLDYLSQLGISDLSIVTAKECNGFITTLAGYRHATIEDMQSDLKQFMKYLYAEGIIKSNVAEDIVIHHVSRQAPIPSTWNSFEITVLLSAIDRNNPIGKRDYAMIILALVLGLRIGDIKTLRFSDFDWDSRKLNTIQNKTGKPLTLPVPEAVGWAVIDYIRNGRPKYADTDFIFVRHKAPYTPFPESNHLAGIIHKYMRKAGINNYRDRRQGFHSLRHTVASMLVEMNTSLPVITNILGHTNSNTTAIYLKTDIEELAQCVLSPEVGDYE
jgi:site-specific recombinase XerD